MIEIIYGVLCLAMLVIVLFLYGYHFHALWIARRGAVSTGPDGWPKVALVIPCKGLDPDLEENLRRHFRHQYPDYRIVFTLADPDDPAVAVLRKVIATEPQRPASVVFAPRLPDCVEKVSNQVAAFRAVLDEVEVIVCGDSDGLPRDAHWLASLVDGLKRCSLISGFRWYIPPRPSFVGDLQSAWDSTWFLLHALGKTTWGGAMAFTCATYRRLRFEEHLACALTDDLALQNCTHRAGERTGFTPGGMMISEPAERFGDFFRWAMRQAQIVRIVNPALWLMGFVGANVQAGFFGLTALLLLLPGPELGRTLPTAAVAVTVLYYLGRGFLAHWMIRRLFPDHPERTALLGRCYLWANFLADLLAPAVVYASLFSGTIRWRGVSYRVRGGRVVRL